MESPTCDAFGQIRPGGLLAEVNDPRWGGKWGGSGSKPLRTLFPAPDWTPESLRQAHLQFLALPVADPLECWRLALETKATSNGVHICERYAAQSSFFADFRGASGTCPPPPPPPALNACKVAMGNLQTWESVCDSCLQQEAWSLWVFLLAPSLSYLWGKSRINSLCFLSMAEEREGEEKETSVRTAGRQIEVMSDYQP